MYEYKAKVISAYDGDTITCIVQLGMNVSVTEKLRLAFINCPEIRGPEREQGLKSRDRIRELILDKEVVIKTYKDKKGKYGRYIAEVYLHGVNINNLLVEEGLAEHKLY